MKPDEKCPDHRPVQHRDGKEPWCPKCGLTRDYVEPATRFSAMKGAQTP